MVVTDDVSGDQTADGNDYKSSNLQWDAEDCLGPKSSNPLQLNKLDKLTTAPSRN